MWSILNHVFPESVVAVLGAVIASTIMVGLIVAIRRWKFVNEQLETLKNDSDSSFFNQFGEREMKSALDGYIEPSCQPSDPAEYDSDETIAEIREPIFKYIERTVLENKDRTFNLIMSDTGVGKTAFCMNLFSFIRKKYPKKKVRLFSLSGEAPIYRIGKFNDKANCLLILDALDEEIGAIENGRDRLDQILDACKEYESVIITCRSQFFISDQAIPRFTKIDKIIPRAISQGRSYQLIRSYLSPFDEKQVARYISKHFPWYKVSKLLARRRASELVKIMPDLAYRPMLLEKLPEIASSKIDNKEIWEMYRTLVYGWADRESRWIDPTILMMISRRLAVHIYKNFKENSGRISQEELESVAHSVILDKQEWKNLNARSLLNRDSVGKIKFAHRSIMEFLIVEAAIIGDTDTLDFKWSDFMKQLLVSWGYADQSNEALEIATSLLSDRRSRDSVLPLSDVWVLPPANGLPNFKRASVSKSFIGKVNRPAPFKWRSNSIEVHDVGYGFSIYDHECNLFWRLHDDPEDVPKTSLGLMINLVNGDLLQTLPSYDQLLSLLEGLHSAGRSDIIKPGDLFYIADRPDSRQHLLVSVGPPSLRIEYREYDVGREMSSTGTKLWCIGTGIGYDLDFSNKVSVRQLWLVERPSLDYDIRTSQ